MLFDPLNHYDYWLINTFCECDLCSEWREARSIFSSSQEETGRVTSLLGNPKWNSALIKYSAVAHRRDLYCEMSFHSAHTYSVSGRQIMEWVREEIYDPDRTPGWWIKRGSGLSIHYWLFRFCRQNGLTSLPLPLKEEAMV